MGKIDANIVIIGGGGAGMPAALTAIEKGANGVVVIDNRHTVGGNANMAGGFLFGVESRLQKEKGDKRTADDVFKETMAFHHYDRVNPRVLRALIDKSGETINWLESLGEKFDYNMNAHILANLTGPVGGYSRVIKLMVGKVKAGGGEILTNIDVKKILRGSDGKISGVSAVNKDGEELQINAKTVILTTGGFPGNKELLKKYFPHYYDDIYNTDAVPLMGGGIKLAEDAGAYLEDYCTLCRETGYSFKTGKDMPNRAAFEASIWVNKFGRRFVDETVSHDNASTNALLLQPGKVGFALFDDDHIQSIIDNPSPFVMTAPGSLNLRERLIEEANSGEWSKVADSWYEIARWIGADPEVLKTEVAEYNSFCEGRDRLFGKPQETLIPLIKPPFYALKFIPLLIDTFGPVRVNEHMEVLDKEQNPIPGFYAGGAITSGWQGYDYHLFGSALGLSINCGRIAGENAEKYISTCIR